MKLKIKKLYDNFDSEYSLPTRMTDGASGYDLRAPLGEYRYPTTIYSGDTRLIRLGFALEIEPGYEGQIRSRSSLAYKYDIAVANSPGTIDADYRGEVCVLLANRGNYTVYFEPGERIAQLVFAKVEYPEIEVVDSLGETARGAGGFGSTGKV